MNWPFDQKEHVSALTTTRVVAQGLPILSVVHYSDDHSWAFLCGTTIEADLLMLASMKQITHSDPTLFEIADLPPGWCAKRLTRDSAWRCYQDESV